MRSATPRLRRERQLAAGARDRSRPRCPDAVPSRRSPCASSGSDRRGPRARRRSSARLVERGAPALPDDLAVPVRPKASSVRRISSAAPGTVRVVSTSSMRTSHSPPAARASSQLATRGDERAEMQRARWARARSGRGSSREQLRGHERILEALHEPLERLALAARAPRGEQPRRRARRARRSRMRSRPAAPRARRSSFGRKPTPSPATCAAAFASIVGTVSTSCPESRPTVRGGSRRERVGDAHRAVALDASRRRAAGARRRSDGMARRRSTISTRPSGRRGEAAARAARRRRRRWRGRRGPRRAHPRCRRAPRSRSAGACPGSRRRTRSTTPKSLSHADHGVDGDAQLRLPALRHLLDAAFEVGGGAQQVPPLVQQLPARLGEHGPVAAAVEELDAQSLLELAARSK